MTIRGANAPNGAFAGFGRRSLGSDILALRTGPVHIRGTQPTHFFQKGIAAAEPEVQQILDREAEAMVSVVKSHLRGIR